MDDMCFYVEQVDNGLLVTLYDGEKTQRKVFTARQTTKSHQYISRLVTMLQSGTEEYKP